MQLNKLTTDLRLKQSWIDAAQAVLNAAQIKAAHFIETATSPEAITAYKAAIAATVRFTYRAFLVSCLLAIALGMSARDTWSAFYQWLESHSLTLNQPVAIVRLVVLQTYERLDTWVQDQTIRAWYQVDCKVTQPAKAFRSALTCSDRALA